ALHRGDVVRAQVYEREAVIPRQGAVTSDDDPQIAAAERLVAGHREGEVDRLGVGRVQRAGRGAACARFEPGEERVLGRRVVLVRARDPGVAIAVDNGVEGLRGKAGAGLDGMGAEVVAGDGVVAVVRGPDRGGRDRDRAGLDPYGYDQCGLAVARVESEEPVRDDVRVRRGRRGEGH